MNVQLPLSQSWPISASPVAQTAAFIPRRTDRVTSIDTSRAQSSDSDSTSVRSARQEMGDKNARSSLFADPDEGFTFWDFLDMINPLHHIPFVNTVYREISGDQIGAAARVLGGAMFGPIGLIGGALDVAFSEITGDTLGGHVLALFNGDDSDSQPSEIAVAADRRSSGDSSGTEGTIMTALEAGILLPMTSHAFMSSRKASPVGTQTPTLAVFPASAVPDSINTFPLLTTREAGIQAAKATSTLPQPGSMPLNRNQPTFMPLGNQSRTAMPLPAVSRYQRQDETTSLAFPTSSAAISAYQAF